MSGAGAAAASYRLSCIRHGLQRRGGVNLNKTKLKMMPVRKAPTVRVSSAYMDAYEKQRTDWVTCKFCGRGLADDGMRRRAERRRMDLETQVEEESSSEEPDPGERERGGEAAPFTITNEDDIEFAIEDDEELYEAALAASCERGAISLDRHRQPARASCCPLACSACCAPPRALAASSNRQMSSTQVLSVLFLWCSHTRDELSNSDPSPQRPFASITPVISSSQRPFGAWLPPPAASDLRHPGQSLLI